MTTSNRDLLAHWRSIAARRSLDVLDIAPAALKARGLGEEEWAIREQLAFAALDMGAMGLAETQIGLLRRKFPDSPRVAILHGMRLEVLGEEKEAREVYEGLLKKDETHVPSHQRLIALLLPQGPSTVIPALITYLDTFYTDADGWSLLAEQYGLAGMHAQALTALGHVMLIQPWDSGAVERAAGVAYTMGDYQLALKHYLRAIEMITSPEGSVSETKGCTRLWWGVRQTTDRLLNSSTSNNTDSQLAPELHIAKHKLEALQQLAVERILEGGARGKGLEAEVTREVVGGKSAPR